MLEVVLNALKLLEDMRRAGSDTLCATLYAGGSGG